MSVIVIRIETLAVPSTTDAGSLDAQIRDVLGRALDSRAVPRVAGAVARAVTDVLGGTEGDLAHAV